MVLATRARDAACHETERLLRPEHQEPSCEIRPDPRATTPLRLRTRTRAPTSRLALDRDVHLAEAERSAWPLRAAHEGRLRVRLPLRCGAQAVLRPRRRAGALQDPGE